MPFSRKSKEEAAAAELRTVNVETCMPHLISLYHRVLARPFIKDTHCSIWSLYYALWFCLTIPKMCSLAPHILNIHLNFFNL